MHLKENGQDAGERSLETGRSTRPRLLLSAVSSAEGVVSHDSLDESEWPCHPDQIQDGDGLLGVEVSREEGLHVFEQPQGCLHPDTHSSGLLTLSMDHAQR